MYIERGEKGMITLKMLRDEVRDLVWVYENHDGFDLTTAVAEVIVDYIVDGSMKFEDFDIEQFLGTIECELWPRKRDRPRDNGFKSDYKKDEK
jgi:hypothetical protein